MQKINILKQIYIKVALHDFTLHCLLIHVNKTNIHKLQYIYHKEK